MLSGTYSHLSFSGKLILLVLLLVSFLLFASMLGLLSLVPFYGKEVLSVMQTPDYSDATLVNAFKVMQIINMGFGMLLPTILFLYLTEKDIVKSSGLQVKATSMLLLVSAFTILSAQPLIGFSSEINNQMQLPDWLSGIENWMKSMEDKGKLLTDAFLNSASWSDLFVNIFMIALLPAFTEELLFRGVLSKLLFIKFKNIHVAVFISAIVFSAVHLQFYGFLPRLLLGIQLGYLFLWSGNLWLPIVAHFVNNFLSVLIQFFFFKGQIATDAENFGTNMNMIVVLASTTLLVLLMIWIYRISNKAPEVSKIE